MFNQQSGVALAGFLLAFGAVSSTVAWGQPGGPSPVVAAKVVEREVATAQTYVGSVLPAKRSSVGSAVDGRVTDYPVNIGERVTKGQPLCRLLTETISLQISAAEAELRLRQEELNELQNGSRPEEIAQAKARLEAAQAARSFAEGRYQRAVQLVKQGQTITQEQLEEFSSAAVAAERNMHAAEQEHRLLVQGPRKERIAQAQAKHDNQQELVRQLQDQLKKHTMIAPFDGYVVMEGTEVGEWVSRSQVVAEIVHLDTIEIEAHVLDAHIDAVRTGMPVRVEVQALRQSPLFVGEIAQISPQADLKSRTFPVRIRVANVIREDGPTLKAGMIARVALPIGAPRMATLIPKDAIVFGGPTPMVYVVTPAPAAPPGAPAAGSPPPAAPPPGSEAVRPVPVELGIADGNNVEVRGNLAAGDRVIVLGNERLRPMQLVNVVKLITPEIAPPTQEAKPPVEPAPQATQQGEPAPSARTGSKS